jgi:hypothetical protein
MNGCVNSGNAPAQNIGLKGLLEFLEVHVKDEMMIGPEVDFVQDLNFRAKAQPESGTREKCPLFRKEGF